MIETKQEKSDRKVCVSIKQIQLKSVKFNQMQNQMV